MRLIIFLASFLLLFSACQDSSKTTEKTDAPKESTTAATNKYKLTAFSPSQSYPDAEIKSVEYNKGKMDFNVADGNYKLGSQTPDAPQKNCANSDKGQHLHVIVDENPYAARYTASFDDLEIEDGEHKMLAFLSRSYHESIKTASAHTALDFMVENGSITKSVAIENPMIWYSRPKGVYKGKADTDKVMLDFYLINTDLNSGNKVKADINGEIHMLEKWQPYYIEGLEMGKNKITLSLLDKDGNLVKTEQNPISREFTLEVDPTE